MHQPFNNQKGALVISVAIILIISTGLLYFYASKNLINVTRQHSKNQPMSYALQISTNLAQNLRWSYDVARAIEENPNNAPLCDPAQGAQIETVGAIKLCLVNRTTCTPHPGRPSLSVCVSLNDNTIMAKRMIEYQGRRAFFLVGMQLMNGQLAWANSPFTPAPPATDVTANDLSAPPICLDGSCEVRCSPQAGANADCLTFAFCPLITGNCLPEELVYQTVGFFR